MCPSISEITHEPELLKHASPPLHPPPLPPSLPKSWPHFSSSSSVTAQDCSKTPETDEQQTHIASQPHPPTHPHTHSHTLSFLSHTHLCGHTHTHSLSSSQTCSTSAAYSSSDNPHPPASH